MQGALSVGPDQSSEVQTVLDHGGVNFAKMVWFTGVFRTQPIFTIGSDHMITNQFIGFLIVDVSAQNPIGNSVSGCPLSGVFAASINATLLKAKGPCASHPAVSA
jgi:hypothetical protein